MQRPESALDLAVAYRYFEAVYATDTDSLTMGEVSRALAHRMLSLADAQQGSLYSLADTAVANDYALAYVLGAMTPAGNSHARTRAVDLAAPHLGFVTYGWRDDDPAAQNLDFMYEWRHDDLVQVQIADHDWSKDADVAEVAQVADWIEAELVQPPHEDSDSLPLSARCLPPSLTFPPLPPPTIDPVCLLPTAHMRDLGPSLAEMFSAHTLDGLPTYFQPDDDDDDDDDVGDPVSNTAVDVPAAAPPKNNSRPARRKPSKQRNTVADENADVDARRKTNHAASPPKRGSKRFRISDGDDEDDDPSFVPPNKPPPKARRIKSAPTRNHNVKENEDNGDKDQNGIKGNPISRATSRLTRQRSLPRQPLAPVRN